MFFFARWRKLAGITKFRYFCFECIDGNFAVLTFVVLTGLTVFVIELQKLRCEDVSGSDPVSFSWLVEGESCSSVEDCTPVICYDDTEKSACYEGRLTFVTDC